MSETMPNSPQGVLTASKRSRGKSTDQQYGSDMALNAPQAQAKDVREAAGRAEMDDREANKGKPAEVKKSNITHSTMAALELPTSPIPDNSIERGHTPLLGQVSSPIDSAKQDVNSSALLKENAASSRVRSAFVSREDASFSYLDSDRPVDPSVPIWRHPKINQYPRTISAAFGLLFIGVVFLFVFIGTITTDPSRALVFGLVSLFTLLPGAYVTMYIYRALKGHAGYRMETIPSFDT